MMKKNAKKFILALVLAFTASFFSPAALTAVAVTDTKPPVLVGYELDKTVVKFPDSIMLTMTITDDVSGLQSIQIVLSSEISSTSYIDHEKIGDNRYRVKMQVKHGMKPSTQWHIEQFILCDNASNRITYYNEEWGMLPSYGPKKLFTIQESAEQDNDPPVLKDITISSNTVAHPGKVVFRARITDKNALSSIIVDLYPDGDSNSSFFVYLSKDSGEWYQGTLDLSTKVNRYKGYKFHMLWITDIHGNSVWYYPPDSNEVQTGYMPSVGKNLHITVTNPRTDITETPPELVSVTADKSSVTAPSYFTLNIKARDFGPGLKEAFIHVSHYNSSGQETELQTAQYIQPFTNGAVSYTVIIPQYIGAGTVKLKQVTIRDNDGNETTYHITPTGNQKDIASFIKNVQVKIMASNPANEISSGTTIDNVVEIVRNAPNDAKIHLDCQVKSVVVKEIFDAIKGTDKVLMLEGHGIQWTFFGAEIKNQTKDIDVNIEIYQTNDMNSAEGEILREFTEKSSSLALQFAPNGTLPGIATVRVKADYAFRNYIGTENLFLYFYNDNAGEMDFIRDKIKMTSDEYYEFTISHNSTYLLSKSSINEKYVSKKSGGKSTGEGKAIVNKIKTTEAAGISEQASEQSQTQDQEQTQASDVASSAAKDEFQKKTAAKAWWFLFAGVGVLLIGGGVAAFIFRDKLKALFHRTPQELK